MKTILTVKISHLAAGLILACAGLSLRAVEIPVNVRTLIPQTIVINRGDTIRWFSDWETDFWVDAYAGDFRLRIEESNNRSAARMFDAPGTNYYNRAGFQPDSLEGRRAGTIIVRDWTNSPPVVMLNSPQNGDIFNCCNGPSKSQEPVPILASTTLATNDIKEVLLLAGESVLHSGLSLLSDVFVMQPDAGVYALKVRVTTMDGRVYQSDAVTIAVEEVQITRLSVELLQLGGRNIVKVSWLEYPQASALGWGETPPGRGQISSTSRFGVRYWMQPADLAPKAFLSISPRF